eukprot:Partr_v1_DN26027_c0_g1_i4_m501 putative cop9 signalosome complex subunit
MSDFGDDDAFMHDDDAGDEFDFEYDDDLEDLEEGSGSAGVNGVAGGVALSLSVQLENMYYTAKSRKEAQPALAVSDFDRVLEIEESASGTGETEWGFKALKQLSKVHLLLGNIDKCLLSYSRLLKRDVGGGVITRNYFEKSISNLMDHLCGGSASVEFVERVLAVTLEVLLRLQYDRLVIRAHLKMAKLYLDKKDFNRMTRSIRLLRDMCQVDQQTSASGGMEDVSKRGTHLLEIYALEIQMYTETRNNKKLKELYLQCLAVKAAIPHPKIMGVVYECGGKMHMSQKEWAMAQQDFFEAFKNYDEAGSPQRIVCLKYLVLANMLNTSQINPFDSQETKPYKNDPQIVAMTNLVSAFQRKEIWEFEKILAANKATIMDDSFIRMYIEDVLKNIRTQVLIKLVKSYSSVSIQFLASQLGVNVAVDEVEELLKGLILNEDINGTIDQPAGLLYLHLAKDDDKEARLSALENWTTALESLIACSIPTRVLRDTGGISNK